MSDKVTVESIVLDIMDVDDYELSADQILDLNKSLKIKSTPREKVNYVKGNGDASKIKLAPQAKILISVLTDTAMSLEDWGDSAAKAGMKTKQDPARIAAYYRKSLVDNQLIKEVPVN